MSACLLESRNLRKSHRLGGTETVVLQNLTASFEPGLCHTIRGASGSGKSTLLQLLGGLDRPTAGEIWWGGNNLASWSPKQLARWRSQAVGFIFQSYHLLPELSAWENVELPARLARRSNRAESRALLKKVGLGHRLDHRPSELSGGEQQRVALARALRNAPSLILADEPTGNLDATTGSTVIDLLFQLQKERGATLLLVTHDVRIADLGHVRWSLESGVIRPIG